MITEAEVAAYHRDGYVVPAGFRFSGKELEVLRAALDGVLSDNPDILPDRLMNPHLNGGKPYGVQGQKAFHALAHDVRILDMAEAVMGPDLVLLFTHLFCKPAESSRRVLWHQDGPFWPVTPLASVTVWLALDNVDADNGAMQVIPGSHRGDYHDLTLIDDPDSTLNRKIDADEIDESKAHVIELEAGQVSLHDIGIVHGSAANTSKRRRAGLALRYMPATSWVYREMPDASADWSTLPIEMVRGQNRHEGNDFTLGEFGRPWV
ncbi:MAG: phytanoyl-CoA dioxygenase family protein [Gammaproteobacteria bacterium]|jgi:hypothetical protein|nr:phytanoyl-CoA dioxygenase family protein [Gammaproteobacteria bacterium]|tara:strand:- start:82 stop:873 length:792 start_codon:yes stop_codon:yes gene_type:complete